MSFSALGGRETLNLSDERCDIFCTADCIRGRVVISVGHALLASFGLYFLLNTLFAFDL